ncbi:MAG: ATP synthase F1 subunit delta [Dehalococcoidia bacterium]|nr:ATP synthase F1 subunit delta [Dehalococcoidia bacterium]
MAEQVSSQDDFRRFLLHAKFSVEVKADKIKKVLVGVDSLIHNLLINLISKGLLQEIPRIQIEYQKLLDRYRKVERAEVFSATSLSATQKQQVATYVEQLVEREVILTSAVDETILGGFVIKVGDKLLDASIRTKLGRMKRDINSARTVALVSTMGNRGVKKNE